MRRVDLKKFIYMNFLIQHKCTGTPEEFARKLETSRSTLFEYLDYIRKELEVNVIYSKYDQTYYYENVKDLPSALGFRTVSDN